MSIREVENMIKKGSWIPTSEDNHENLEDGEEDEVTNGRYYIQVCYMNDPRITCIKYIIL